MNLSSSIGFAPRVPRFFLYGEPPQDADAHFLHVETIADRSRLHDWKIAPHSHRDLNQLLVIDSGCGTMRAEGLAQPFRGPALLAVPAATVHAFGFEPDIKGHVITVADAAIRELARREPAFHTLFGTPSCAELDARVFAASEIPAAVHALQREVVWAARASVIAAEARLITVLVGALRTIAEHAGGASPKRGRRAFLLARFRDLLESRFRAAWSVVDYARELHVSSSVLRAACLDLTGKPPTRLVHERLLVEAKRSLVFTNMTVAETAYDLGFADPAYFSRFFRDRVGVSPAAFRRRES